MKTPTINPTRVMYMLFIALPYLLLTSCSNSNGGYSKEMQAKIDSMQNILKSISDGNATLAKNLVTFDTLDYTVFTNQEWVRLHESHSKDIVVNWPDGHHTNGIERHIEDLKALFVYAPDTRINSILYGLVTAPVNGLVLWELWKVHLQNQCHWVMENLPSQPTNHLNFPCAPSGIGKTA